MSNIVYLSIYQTPEGHKYTHHDLFTTGKLSGMIGCGPKKYALKPGSVSLIVAKSANPSDTKDIDLALVKIKNPVSYNPWKDYGHFVCYDVDFIATKTIKYNDEDSGSQGRIFDVARSIGSGMTNSAKTRELALYLYLQS